MLLLSQYGEAARLTSIDLFRQKHHRNSMLRSCLDCLVIAVLLSLLFPHLSSYQCEFTQHQPPHIFTTSLPLTHNTSLEFRTEHQHLHRHRNHTHTQTAFLAILTTARSTNRISTSSSAGTLRLVTVQFLHLSVVLGSRQTVGRRLQWKSRIGIMGLSSCTVYPTTWIQPVCVRRSRADSSRRLQRISYDLCSSRWWSTSTITRRRRQSSKRK